MLNSIQSIAGFFEPILDIKSLKTPQVRRVILIVAALGFFLGIYLSLRAQPTILSDMRLWPALLLVLITVPITVALNAYEFVLSARLIGRQIGFGMALEIAILGSAANMLPIPGATMVRVLALNASGSSFKHGVSTTVFAALIWAGMSFGYAGIFVVILGNIPIGILLAVIGISIVCGSIVLVGGRLGKHQIVLGISATRLGLVVLDATRISLSFMALGLDASFAEASVLTVSGALGSAFSLVPAGLGLREAVAAAIAPFVTLAASSTFLATSLNRILGLMTIAPFAIFLGLRLKGRRE